MLGKERKIFDRYFIDKDIVFENNTYKALLKH